MTVASRGLRTQALIALTLVLALVLVGCARSGPNSAFTNDEARLVAWYIEDVARGDARDAKELLTENASGDLLRVAEWARAGFGSGAHHDLPHQLGTRRSRWPALASLLRQGAIATANEGLVLVHPDAPSDIRGLAQTLCDEENADRRSLDTLVPTLTKPVASIARTYSEQVRQARVELDTADGGKIWNDRARAKP